MVSGIEHTAIASPDPRRLAQWYVEHVDFTINYQSTSSSTVFVKASDGSMIEIIESKGERPPAPAMRDPGIRHMALTVTDFDAVYDRLRAKNVNFLGDPEDKGGNRVVFFTDCDGNILHLLKRLKPLP
jgi:glyoxylase I family protein